MDGNVLTVTRTIAAPGAAIFDVLADAGRHAEIDGSGTVQGARAGTSGRLALGDTFGMSMKMGVRYSTVNRVVEFEEDRRIAWRTGPEGTLGRFVGGRIWRYVLEPVEGGTLVSESWDITPDPQRFLLKLGGIYSNKTRANMVRTLERLDEVVAGG